MPALAALWAAPARAGAEPAALLPGAGGGAHAWIALPPADDAGAMTILCHMPAAAPPGSMRFGPRLRSVPVAVGAWGERVFFVLEFKHDGRPQRRVESVRVESAQTGQDSGFYVYLPRGRDPEVKPSLPPEGDLVAFAATGAGAMALIVDTAQEPPTPRLLALRGTAWRDVALPASFDAARAWSIIVQERRVGLIGIGAEPDAGAWSVHWAPNESFTGRDHEAASARISPPWVDETLPGPAGATLALAAGGQIVGATLEAGGHVRLHLVRSSGAHEIARVAHEGDSVGVVGVGENVGVVWRGPEADPRLYTVVVSSVSGQTLHAGVAQTQPIVSGRDIQTLALLMGAIVLTVLIFVLRPDPVDRQIVTIPDGMCLADAWRRVVAALVDVAAPVALATLLVRAPLADVGGALLLSPEAGIRGAIALLVGVGLAIVHSTICEAITGRTLGKALTRCRTFNLEGARPSPMQAFMRNGLKYMCPPLTLFVLIDPRRRHPGDILSRTVVLMRAPEPPDRTD
ncbi:MAG: RDD family protein [Phycisphaerales bacterium]|nr:MAG: RDD family protein [Phycisphaerales bacterium]